MVPIWDTEIVYDESLTMVERNGKSEARLLFTPQEVISVTSADKNVNPFLFGFDTVLHRVIYPYLRN